MTLPSLPEPGALLAERYRIVRLIGEGGMGAVLEAENTLAHKRVAIKLLHPSLSENSEAAQRLVREAQACCRVRHPNVVEIFDVVQQNDTLFLVMELLEGEPLSALIERGGVPAHEFIHIVLQAMRGVAAVHAAGVIHRDIHPGNILLTREPSNPSIVPKVLDFGIAKIHDQEHALTGSGITMGTPLYISYEQLCNARDIDARTDIYPFGVILYQGLTGKPPFEANTLTELLIKLTKDVPVPAKQLAPEIPGALDRLISWALERDRDKRIGSMDAFIDELEPFASARAFRSQMTDAQRTLPAIVPPRGVPSTRDSRPSEDENSVTPAQPTLPEVAAVHATPNASVPPASLANFKAPRTRLILACVAVALAFVGVALFISFVTRKPTLATRVAVPSPPPLPLLDAGQVQALTAAVLRHAQDPVAPAQKGSPEPHDGGFGSQSSAQALGPEPSLSASREEQPTLESKKHKLRALPAARKLRFRAGEPRPKDF